MVNARTKKDNTDTEEMIEELSDIARRKRRTAEHIEEAIARYHERQGLTDSFPRFNRGEVGQG